MNVDRGNATQKAEHNGKTYYFCSPGCKNAFEANPGKFLDPPYKPSM